MDNISWMIANLHQLLGHDKAAAVLGVAPWPGPVCLLCEYERHPSPERRAAVLAALGTPARDHANEAATSPGQPPPI